MKHVVMYSGGIGSWSTAKHVVDAYGADNTILLFADVKGDNDNPHLGEDEDTYRFIRESSDKLGAELVWLKEGRSIWQVFHDDHFLGNSRLANCFAPETRFITDSGIKSFREVVGQPVRVLTGRGWRAADVKSFGEQQLCELRLKRYGDTKTIEVTAEHSWPVRAHARDGGRVWKETSGLRPGDRILNVYGNLCGTMKPSPVGVAAGFTYGDGTCSKTPGVPARAFLCGEKDAALLPYFASCRTIVDGRGVIYVLDLPRTWKLAPALNESTSYLYGWLSGYFAADGSMSKNGSAILHSASRESLEVVKDVCARIGIGTSPIHTVMRKGFGDTDTPLHNLTFVLATLREDFFIIPAHREHFIAAPKSKRSAEWEVDSVSPGRRGEVMCAVVPGEHAFALEDNIYTSNCSKFLKQRPCHEWLHANTAPDAAIVYVGIDWSESHRLPAIERAYEPWVAQAPLCDPPYIDKRQMLADCREWGVEPPRMYALPYPHGNCGGFCVRAGQAQFRLLLNENRERYLYHEGQEQKLRDHLGKDVSILRDRAGGASTPLTLREFRQRQESDPSLFDELDWGGCGCFVEVGRT
ncbi:MAG: LAGLIDADG family homing endonuclease [Mycobacterium sp.]